MSVDITELSDDELKTLANRIGVEFVRSAWASPRCQLIEAIRARLWDMARRGSLIQSTVASAVIRELHIESPEGDNPDDA